MKARCYLRTIRGRRSLAQLAALAGINKGTLSMIERGRMLPKDAWIEAMENAYGVPFEEWYPALTVRALELDEEEPA